MKKKKRSKKSRFLEKFLNKDSYNRTIIKKYKNWNSKPNDLKRTIQKLKSNVNPAKLPHLLEKEAHISKTDKIRRKRRVNRSMQLDKDRPKAGLTQNRYSMIINRAEDLRRKNGFKYNFPAVAMTKATYSRLVRNDRHSKSTAPGYSRNYFGKPFDQ